MASAKPQDRAGGSAPAASIKPVSDQPNPNQIVKLTFERVWEILNEAQFAGASEEDIDRLKRELTSEVLTAGTLQKLEQSVAEILAQRSKDCRTYYIQDNCRVRFHRTQYGPGDRIRLTEDEAADMAELVTSQKPKAPQPPIEKRVAGVYRVAGPGKVKFARKFRSPGDLLELGADDAREFGALVEFVPPDELPSQASA